MTFPGTMSRGYLTRQQSPLEVPKTSLPAIFIFVIEGPAFGSGGRIPVVGHAVAVRDGWTQSGPDFNYPLK